MRCGRRARTFAAGALFIMAAVRVAAQMPDVRAMAGLAIPSPDLPDGTVTVRVVRQNITNNLLGIEVQLHGVGPVRTAKTGPDGRARFEGIAAGAAVRAIAIVDGERLTSSEFQVPARGGIRTLLAAGLQASGSTPAPPRAGSAAGESSALSLGRNSRVVVEFADDVLQVFYLLEIVNAAATPAKPSSPLIIELPDVAEGATLLEGSSKQATVAGRRVSIGGPFSPAMMSVQIAYRIGTFGESLTLNQAFPLPFQMPVMAVQKIGEMRVSSPQLARTQEVPIQNNVFVMGTGPALPANAPLTLTISGLPHHSRTPVWLTFFLAAVIVAAGVWLASSPRGVTTRTDRERLQDDREERLTALASLEAAHAAGRVDASTYQTRRAAMLAELERIYAALDDTGGLVRRDVA